MIRPYQKDDEVEINNLFTEVFHKQRSIPHWEWKYKGNVLNKTIVTVAEENKEIAGHVALVPFKGKWFHENIYLGARTDTMVSPKHRGKGIYKDLNVEMIQQASEQGLDYLFGYPAPKAKELFLKYTGAQEIGFVPRLMKINKVSNLLESRFSALKLAKPLLKWADVFFRSKNTSLPTGYRIESKTAADSSFDELWERGKQLSNISLVRDADFINWRFTNHPDWDYSILALYKEEKLIGYIVTRTEEKQYGTGKVLNGYIVDVFADGEKEVWDLLISAGIQNLHEADVIQTWALDHTLLFKCLTSTFSFKHKDSPMPLVGKKITESLSDGISLSDWYITPADVDSF
ncbi:GNAT family N-acetyltransferase [Bacillus seohaeanensis]|jgi:predicted GNAT family acetyltransferase|uniref:GNAT family N-acetyltransferase n=1 Tax=Bacillus seohaeanensis TaxID=284580 RepID=A0ABW5RYR7_9BACI